MFACQPGLNRANRSKDASFGKSIFFIFTNEKTGVNYSIYMATTLYYQFFCFFADVTSGASAVTAFACTKYRFIETSLLDYTLLEMFTVRQIKLHFTIFVDYVSTLYL